MIHVRHVDEPGHVDSTRNAEVCCGAWTNWAVEHMCRDAADHGYEVVVVTDATATISEEFQNAALNYALTTVATRATAAEVTEALG